MRDRLRPAERRRLATIMQAAEDGDWRGALALMRQYYANYDRADRTPRNIMYLHMGMLIGYCETYGKETEVAAKTETQSAPAAPKPPGKSDGHGPH